MLHYYCILFLSIKSLGNYISFDNPRKFAINMISMLATWIFFFNGNINVLFYYYLWDLLISIIDGELLFSLHHIITIGVLCISDSHIDYHRMIILVKLFKTGDLFLYIGRLLKYGPRMNPFIKSLLSLIFTFNSILLWLLFRLLLSIRYAIYLESNWVYAFCILYLGSIYWFIKKIYSCYIYYAQLLQ